MMSETTSSLPSSGTLTYEEGLNAEENTESTISVSTDPSAENAIDPTLNVKVEEADPPLSAALNDPIDDDYYNDVIGTDFQLPKTTATFSARDLTSIFRIQADESSPVYRPLNILPSLSNVIEDQKKRAIRVWDGVMRQGSDPLHCSLPTSIPHADAQRVRAQLKEGLVPPIFHAFTIPEEYRIFHPYLLVNTGLLPAGSEGETVDRPVRLSLQPAVEGLSATSRHSSMAQFLSSSDTSFDVYLPTMDNTTNALVPLAIPRDTDEMDPPVMSYETDFMKTFIDSETGFAYDTVYDPGYIGEEGWTFNAALTRHIVHLLNTPAEMIGEDVESTALTSRFGLEQEASSHSLDKHVDTNLITRRLSRGVVLDCFRQMNRPTRTFAITGNSGIGKSYTLLFALQQALLFDRICVIFFMQKQRKAMICIRDGEKVYAWEGNTVSDYSTSSLFTNPNVVVLLDPIDATDGGATFDKGARRLIYAASNHSAHFKPDWTKISARKRPAKWKIPERERYLSPFTEEELRIALPYIIDVNKSTFDEAMQRTNEVGMNLRYISAKEAYEARKQQIDNYLEILRSDPTELELLLDWNGMIGKEHVNPNKKEDVAPVRVTTISAADRPDDFLEVDGIIVDTIGSKERILQECPTRPPPIPASERVPSTPGAHKKLKIGRSLNIDGTMIFSINAAEYLPINKMASPRSAAWIGYHGDQGVKYTEQKMTIASLYIYDSLVQHMLDSRSPSIVKLWAKVGAGAHNGMKDCISDLFWQYIREERKFLDKLDVNIPREQKIEHQRKFKLFEVCKGKENINQRFDWSPPFYSKDRKVHIDTKELWQYYYLKHTFITRNTYKHRPMLGRMMDDCTMIQFSGPGRAVYQIVTDDEYYLYWPEMLKLLVRGGYLEDNLKPNKKHGRIRCSPNPPPALHWYWVVPSTYSKEKWEQRGPAFYKLSLRNNESLKERHARRELNRNILEVNTCLKKNVVQHILVMDTLHFSPPSDTLSGAPPSTLSQP